MVMKFGGTSVGSAERIRNLTDIVRSRLKKKPVVVVSTLSGVTDALIDLANESLRGNGAKEKFELIRERHCAVMRKLGLDTGIISRELERLKSLSNSIKLLEELTPKTLDSVMSFGERMSSRMIAAYMSSAGIKSRAYDAYDLGMITDSNFGRADVLPEAYPMIRKSILGIRDATPVVTGFIGKDRSGRITTLGRGGSDYTASIIGSAVGAELIEIWTDVNGIMTADPKIVKGAKSIDTISYEEASELAFLGAKVLHPNTITPAISKRIPVRILNTFNPSHAGTTVLKSSKKKRVVSIACKKGIEMVDVHTPRMFMMHGFLKRVFGIFDSLGISVDMVSTSEADLSVTLDQSHDLYRLAEELGKFADVDIKKNRAKISIVGSGMAYRRRLLGRIFSTLNGIDIEMISSSASEINQSLVVREKDADIAVRRLHETFFGA